MSYNVRNENKKIPIKENSNLTLYQACLKVENILGGIVVSSGKLIAFWCAYHNKVKVGFSANDYERQQVLNFYK